MFGTLDSGKVKLAMYMLYLDTLAIPLNSICVISCVGGRFCYT